MQMSSNSERSEAGLNWSDPEDSLREEVFETDSDERRERQKHKAEAA